VAKIGEISQKLGESRQTLGESHRKFGESRPKILIITLTHTRVDPGANLCIYVQLQRCSIYCFYEEEENTFFKYPLGYFLQQVYV
jgi:hypothetical protein